MASRRKVEVSILGKPYTLVSDNEDEIREIADLVDKHMREAIESGHAQNSEKAAVLAALNIAGEYFNSRQDRETLRKEVEDRAEALLKTLPVKQ